MNSQSIGIMQGRLSPPTRGRIQAFPEETWEREFQLAREIGLAHIEWVYDVESADSTPLLSDPGRIRDVCDRTGVKIPVVCGDYFRDRPVIRATTTEIKERIALFERLCQACRRLSIPSVMIPFVDFSAIQGEEELPSVVAALRGCLTVARGEGVQILLETNLEPRLYRRLLETVADPALGVNYDMGDCASLGHEAEEEITALGQWIRGLHVKDRPRNGSTVPLGSGAVDFPLVFRALESAHYRGPITLQTARGVSGDEAELARRNIAFVQSRICALA